MTAPGDVTANYVQLMSERGWDWDDLAAEFERQAVGPPMPLDRGQNARSMAAWARSQADAGQARQAALERLDDRPADVPVDPMLSPIGGDAGRAQAAYLDVARSIDEAGEQRREAAAAPGAPEPRPDDAAPDAPPRKAVPPRKRTA